MAHTNIRNAHVSGVLIVLLAFLTAIDSIAIDLYLPAFLEIERDLGIAQGKAQQTISVFLLGMAVGQGVYGPFLDRFGRKTPLLAGFAIFTIGSLLAAFAPNFELLLVARFLQSLGAAAGLVTPRAVAADICSMSQAARVFSLLMQVMMISPIVAPLLGGFLLGFTSWRALFEVMFILGVVGFVWSFFCLPDTLPPNRRTPLRPKAIGRSFYLFFYHKRFMALTLAGSFFSATLFFFLGYSAVIFQSFFALSPVQYGYLYMNYGILSIFAGMASNALLAKGFKEKSVLFFGIFLHLGFAFAAWIVALLSEQPNFWAFAVPTMLSMGSLGFIYGNLTAITMFEVRRRLGTASALIGVMQYLFAAIISAAASFFAPQIAYLPMVIVFCGVAGFLLCFVKN